MQCNGVFGSGASYGFMVPNYYDGLRYENYFEIYFGFFLFIFLK